MVLMLRSLGIPARLVTGYLGGELNPIEGYYVVRESNSHAWVEAYLQPAGWTVFDPTPPAGRPSHLDTGWAQLFFQVYDYLEFRWDRYILTYGIGDQLSYARRFSGWWTELWKGRGWFRDSGGESSESRAPAELKQDVDEPDVARSPSEWLPLAVALLLAFWWIWRHRPAPTATRAYRALRSKFDKSAAGAVVSSAPPLALADSIRRDRPAAAAPSRRIIELYLRESFGGQVLRPEELEDLQRDLREALRKMRPRPQVTEVNKR
jgi:hypothetical protein